MWETRGQSQICLQTVHRLTDFSYFDALEWPFIFLRRKSLICKRFHVFTTIFSLPSKSYVSLLMDIIEYNNDESMI